MSDLSQSVASLDPVRDLILAAQQVPDLLATIQQAWRTPSPLLNPSSIGGAKPPTDLFIRRVHYKPFVRGRLVVEVSGGGTLPDKGNNTARMYFAIQIYPSLKKARKQFEKLAQSKLRRTPGPPVLFLPRFHAVLTCLPNSPRLRKLRYLLQPKKFRHLLERHGLPRASKSDPRQGLHLVRLVPRKRALFRYVTKEGAFYIKLFTKDGCAQAAADLQRIQILQREPGLDFRVPSLLAYDSKAHLIVMDELPGDQVTAHYSTRDPKLWERCGRGLASLHAITLGADAPRWNPAGELAAIEKGCADIVTALPGIEPRVQSLLQALRDYLPTMEVFPPRAIHANLFGDQILDDGQQLSIVDWEDLCAGDPCFDVGRLGAHLLSSAVTEGFALDHAQRALVKIEQAHRQALGENLLAPPRFAWHLVGALLLRAKIGSLRPLTPQWQHEIESTVELAEGIRAGTLGPWRLPSAH